MRRPESPFPLFRISPAARWVLALVLGLGLWLVATPVRAQGAKEFYDRAEKAYALGNFNQALEYYKKSLDIQDTKGLYYNIAQCHRQLKQWEKAIFFYKRFLSSAEDAEMIRVTREHLAASERELARETADLQARQLRTTGRITVLTRPSGARIWSEGKERCASPCSLDLMPGQQMLVMKKKGYQESRHKLTMRPDTSFLLERELRKEIPFREKPSQLLIEQPIGWSWCLGSTCSSDGHSSTNYIAVGATALFSTRLLEYRHLRATASVGPTFMMLAAGSVDDVLMQNYTYGGMVRVTLPLRFPFLMLFNVNFEVGRSHLDRGVGGSPDQDRSTSGWYGGSGVMLEFPVHALIRLGLTARVYKFRYDENDLEYRAVFVGLTWAGTLPWEMLHPNP